MLPANITELRLVTFTLLGIPGFEQFHSIISVPLFIVFCVSVVGNPLIFFIILSDRSLHTPMYVFLSLLAITDFMFTLSIVPQMLANFWFHSPVVSFGQCLVQMFFVHFLSYMESGVLVAMAFDRYTAICHPLRYFTILTSAVTSRIGLVLVLRGVLIISPCFYLIVRLPFCGHKVITNPYCDHMSIAKVSCGDITINSLYGMIQLILAVIFDISSIVLSYAFIICAVLKLPSKEARSKTFSTCSSHVCVISLFYIPCAFSLLAYRFGKHIPRSVHSIISLIYLQLPPMMNPVVYGGRTGQIRDKICKLLQRMKQ
ncbi:olfactory receptor 52D1-like [Hyperolius riggenbachi]|uniref:olfactory receptor 52D1-like n=1 Tax=Hyperolius riggenbachi TaxID=752182 RepID=UPI0035A2A772